MRYEPALDWGSLTAIDTHVHVDVDDHGHYSLPEPLTAAAKRYFKSGDFPRLDETAEYYRERSIAAVIFTVDAHTSLGHPAISNDEIAAGAARHNDILIPFGSVDPHDGPAAVSEARRLVTELGMRGFKFHPTVQAFDPSDEAWFPLYEEIQRLGVPALFHTGQNGIGAGTAGGYGLRLRYSNPLLLDDVAAAFPELQIIMAHPSVPWQDEAISIATHKANTWIDLSGWAPKYFPQALVKAAGSFLQDSVLFGSDYALITPDRWLREFADLDIADAVRPKILKQNALRLLGVPATESGA